MGKQKAMINYTLTLCQEWQISNHAYGRGIAYGGDSWMDHHTGQ
jgi:hypothetical protein